MNDNEKYYTYKIHSNSLEDLINDNKNKYCTYKSSSTEKYITDNLEYFNKCKSYIIEDVNYFKSMHKDISKLYTYIRIPKRKGGYREIHAPSKELKDIQKRVADFFSNQLYVYPHNSAQAYIKHRDTLTNAQNHQNCKMIVALDLKDFFTSIKKEKLITQLYKIGNISSVLTKEELENILDVCLLDNCLPQGSSASPLLSNLFMIQFDYDVELYAKKHNIVYTRYADDLFFSGDTIKPKALIIEIKRLIDKIDLGIKLNEEKTKILRPGKCYITGIKINKENKLTYGHEKKKELKHKIYNLFIKELNNELIKEEVQEVLGLFSYAKRIEPEYFTYLEEYYLKKFNYKHKKLTEHFKYIL